jgi:hypothetical protein
MKEWLKSFNDVREIGQNINDSMSNFLRTSYPRLFGFGFAVASGKVGDNVMFD